jgi:hypothetical protein
MLGMVVKGDLKEHQILALHKLKAAGTIFIDMFDGQADIDDYEAPTQHQGMKYTLDNGQVNVKSDQLDMDEVIKSNEEVVAEIEAGQKEAAVSEEVKTEVPTEVEKQVEKWIKVEVLKAFKYLDKSRKKGEVIDMPEDTAIGLEGLVKVIILEDLPF